MILTYINLKNCSYADADLLDRIKQLPKLEKLHLTMQGYYGNVDHWRQFSEKFKGFPSLKILILRDPTFFATGEREEELMKIKGLIYADCQRY